MQWSLAVAGMSNRKMNAWLERRSRWILAVTLLTSVGLRWFRIGARGFWYTDHCSKGYTFGTSGRGGA
jgi:hypothetical protein